MIRVIGKWAAGIFLLLNLCASLSVLHDNGLDVPALLLGSTVLLLCFWQQDHLVRKFCFLFGVSFPFYCYQAYTLYNHVFEYLVVVLGFAAWARLWHGERARRMDLGLPILLVLPMFLALLSLSLFPLASFLRLLLLWGWSDFSSAVLSATPENPLYAVAAVNRLLLFFCVIFLLSMQEDARLLYRSLFRGTAAGALLAVLFGILHQSGYIDLSWFRNQFLDPSGVPRLHSVSGNPGWFAQFLLASLPLILFLLPGRCQPLLRVGGLLVLFSAPAVALLLTASRTGWLLFPVIVLCCCLSVLLKRDDIDPEARRTGGRGKVQGVVLLVFIGLLVVGTVCTSVYRQVSRVPGTPGSRADYIMQRLRHILTPGERARIWQDTMVLAKESPIFGLGYEGYKWHQQVMNSIPSSRFAGSRQARANWDTPHNFALQLVISNGLAGLLLWLLPIGATFALLWRDFRVNQHAAALPVMTSLLALLLYGFTQSIQYIPLIWFLFFLLLGYAMTVEEKVVPDRLRHVGFYLLPFPVLLVSAGGWFYVTHSGSGYLAARYGVSRYATDRGDVEYTGFFPREDWGANGIYRWSGPRSEMMLPSGGLFVLTFVCNAPGLASDPIILDVSRDGQPLDRYTFWQAGKVNRTYWIPEQGIDSAPIRLTVSRTWNPRLAGQGEDTRNLGVAVGEPRFLSNLLLRDVGFSEVRQDGTGKRGPQDYHWTGVSAVINPARYASGSLRLLLRGNRPYLAEHPLVVRFFQDQVEVKVVRIGDHTWREESMPANLRSDRPLRLAVDKTWNARREGYGDDGRDLGVALSFLSSMTAKVR